jgi:alanine dehydrogenase
MPGAVARTSTYALNNVTLPYALKIADFGWKEAMKNSPDLLNGLNVWNGLVTCAPVARELGYEVVPTSIALQ